MAADDGPVAGMSGLDVGSAGPSGKGAAAAVNGVNGKDSAVAVAPDTKVSDKDGEAPEATDFANYFCTYAYLYHQKDMLEDRKRTLAYYQACVNNRACFKGKTVLDVGTGSGILAIFAAKAGARKVYAVEATDMASKAKKLVEANGLMDVVEVIQGTIETVQLPEKVDLIISEWMGYFLLRESMLDSVLVARDRFLKPEGAMYPSHAAIYLAPIWTHNKQNNRLRDYQGAVAGWEEFAEDVQRDYGVDVTCLTDDYGKEQRDYFLGTAQWTDVHPEQLMGRPHRFKSYDLKVLTLEELRAPLKERLSLRFDLDRTVEALCGWFDVDFRGSKENPAYLAVNLPTGPDATGATHWGQQTFYLGKKTIQARQGDTFEGTIEVVRRTDNQRLLAVQVDGEVVEGPRGRGGSTGQKFQWQWSIE